MRSWPRQGVRTLPRRLLIPMRGNEDAPDFRTKDAKLQVTDLHEG